MDPVSRHCFKVVGQKYLQAVTLSSVDNTPHTWQGLNSLPWPVSLRQGMSWDVQEASRQH